MSNNYLPVYPFINSDMNGSGRILTLEQITQPGIVYKDAYTGKILPGPAKIGDRSVYRNIKYHVGEYHECPCSGKVIAFHHCK